MIDVQTEKGTQTLPVYLGEESVKGKVLIKTSPGKKIEHQGIRVDFIGQIELFYDRGNHYQFTSLTQELAPAGILDGDKEFEFEFANAEKKDESYNGINARLRYFLKVVITRSFAINIKKEQDIWVINYSDPPSVDKPIKMEVGIEDCLHIEFEYLKSKYHLRDVVIGKIYFLLVRLKIKYMELALQKRESTGTGPNLYSESETLTKFEIMDGVPVRGESIPVRLFLGAFELTPSYRNVHGKFSVKYFLNLVLVDEEDRRYFKQQEVSLWRKKPGAHLDQETKVTARHTGTRTLTKKKSKKAKKSAKQKTEAKNTDEETPAGQSAGDTDVDVNDDSDGENTTD